MQLRHDQISHTPIDARECRTGLLGFTDDLHAIEYAEQRGYTAPHRYGIVDEKNTQGRAIGARVHSSKYRPRYPKIESARNDVRVGEWEDL
jgi:hypothetical protein